MSPAEGQVQARLPGGGQEPDSCQRQQPADLAGQLVIEQPQQTRLAGFVGKTATPFTLRRWAIAITRARLAGLSTWRHDFPRSIARWRRGGRRTRWLDGLCALGLLRRCGIPVIGDTQASQPLLTTRQQTR